MGKRPDTVRLTYTNHTNLLLEGIWGKFERGESADLFIDIGFEPNADPIGVHALLISIVAPNFLDKFINSRSSLHLERSVITSIIEFLYRGRVDIREDDLEVLTRTAETLGIDCMLDAINESSEKLLEAPRQIVTRNSTKRCCTKLPSSLPNARKRKRRQISRKKCSSTEDEEENSSDSDLNLSEFEVNDGVEEDESDQIAVTVEVKCQENFNKEKLNEAKKGGMTIIKCPLCDYETSKQEVYSKHLNIKHRLDAKKNRVQIHFKCSECGFISTSKDQLNDHKKSQHEKRKFQCPDCEFFTDKKKTFDRHVNCYHSVDRPFKCHSCDYTARTLKLLTSHRKIHSGETFECKVCSRGFTTKCYLDRHMKLHTNTEKKFSCQFCTHKSRSRHDMDKHLKTLHSFVRPKPLETKPKSQIPIGGYKCTHCEYKTRYRTCWVDHLASKHKVDPDGNTVVPNIKCKLCDFTCLVQYQLYTHMAKVHLEKRFKCQQCPYSSFRKADITLHMKSKHGQERPYMCETCGFRSKTQCDIRRHTLTHTIGKRFVCEFCNKAYAFKYYLTKHMLRVHPKNDKKLRCCLCSYTTKTPPYLIGHTKRMHKEVNDPENSIQRAVVMDSMLDAELDVFEPSLPNLEQALSSCQQMQSFH